jgi:TonB family protein
MRFVILSIFLLAGPAWSSYAIVLDGTHPQSQEPTVVNAIPAIYPRIAAVAEVSGTVVIEVKIKPDGTVGEANAVDGHKLFRVAAEKSSRLWVFNPITASNISRTARLTFAFKLIPKVANPEDLLPVFMPPYSVESRATTPGYVFHKNVDPSNRKSKRIDRR